MLAASVTLPTLGPRGPERVTEQFVLLPLLSSRILMMPPLAPMLPFDWKVP